MKKFGNNTNPKRLVLAEFSITLALAFGETWRPKFSVLFVFFVAKIRTKVRPLVLKITHSKPIEKLES